MIPEKNLKGDIGATQVITDLVKKGYVIFTPLVCESLRFDIIAYKDGLSKRIQCKYSSDGHIREGTCWSDRRGNHKRKYKNDDFDYYGVYLSKIDKVIYPSILFKGIVVSTELGNSAQPFYWWEDFIEFTDVADKKTYKHFNLKLTKTVTEKVIESRIKNRKVPRPTKDVLQKLLWEIPTVQIAKKYNVSDNSISKWAKSYGIDKPPPGYWAKKSKKNK